MIRNPSRLVVRSRTKTVRLISSQSLFWMSQKPKIISTEELSASEAKWVTLQKIKWQDPTGHDRIWESASRKTQPKSGLDAVDILAIIRSESNHFPPSTIIIEQFRPPVGKFVIEMPAGLVDAEESPENAAVRELKEETGFTATLADVAETSFIQVSDAGMTNATMKMVTINITIPADQKRVPNPKQNLDAGEFIVKRIVELDKLAEILKEYAAKDYVVDAKLAHFVDGYELARKLKSVG